MCAGRIYASHSLHAKLLWHLQVSASGTLEMFIRHEIVILVSCLKDIETANRIILKINNNIIVQYCECELGNKFRQQEDGQMFCA
jgi:hypothetical protein